MAHIREVRDAADDEHALRHVRDLAEGCHEAVRLGVRRHEVAIAVVPYVPRKLVAGNHEAGGGRPAAHKRIRVAHGHGGASSACTTRCGHTPLTIQLRVHLRQRPQVGHHIAPEAGHPAAVDERRGGGGAAAAGTGQV